MNHDLEYAIARLRFFSRPGKFQWRFPLHELLKEVDAVAQPKAAAKLSDDNFPHLIGNNGFTGWDKNSYTFDGTSSGLAGNSTTWVSKTDEGLFSGRVFTRPKADDGMVSDDLQAEEGSLESWVNPGWTDATTDGLHQIFGTIENGPLAQPFISASKAITLGDSPSTRECALIVWSQLPGLSAADVRDRWNAAAVLIGLA